MKEYEIIINGIYMAPITWWGEKCVDDTPPRKRCHYFSEGAGGDNMCMAFEEEVAHKRCQSCIQAVGK